MFEDRFPSFERMTPIIQYGVIMNFSWFLICGRLLPVERAAMVQDCQIVHGHVAFTVLFHLQPAFGSEVDVSLGEQVERFIALALAQLMGPKPEELVYQSLFRILQLVERLPDGVLIGRWVYRQRRLSIIADVVPLQYSQLLGVS